MPIHHPGQSIEGHPRAGLGHLGQPQVNGICQQRGEERGSIFGRIAGLQVGEVPTVWRQGEIVVIEFGVGRSGTRRSYQLGLGDAQAIADSVVQESSVINRVIVLRNDPTTGELSYLVDVVRHLLTP